MHSSDGFACVMTRMTGNFASLASLSEFLRFLFHLKISLLFLPLISFVVLDGLAVVLSSAAWACGEDKTKPSEQMIIVDKRLRKEVIIMVKYGLSEFDLSHLLHQYYHRIYSTVKQKRI